MINPSSDTMTLRKYFREQIPKVLRPPTKHLPFPYIVPGGIFFDELWDWDSFWLTKGLLPLLKEASNEESEVFLTHAQGSWKNFFENQGPNGSLPIMAKTEHPDFFECTSDETGERNQAKPIFGQFAEDIAEFSGDYTWIEPYFERLLKYYDRWFSRYGTDIELVVWGSDVAAGVDNDPTTYGRPPFSSANLLLNCLLYRDLNASAKIAAVLKRPEAENILCSRASKLGSAILMECWDETDEFFYTVDVQCLDHRPRYLPTIKRGMDMSWRSVPLKIKTFTGFLPMWCGIADKAQAEALVKKHLLNPQEFDARWGIASLARNERMYEPATDSANPSNWLGPVWIVANYMIYEGLKKYHYDTEAEVLAAKTRELLINDLRTTGRLHECYHPDTGQPNFNADFLSWNVLAGLMA